MNNMKDARRGIKYGCALGLAYVANVQMLTWMGFGLTGWVFALDMVLVFVSLLALHWRARTRPGSEYGLVASALSLGLMILTAGLIQQFYMVIYIAFINPNWVDMVMEIREGLLTSAGVAPEEIQQRLASTRRGFAPLAMLSMGLLVPALWTLAFALLLSVPIRAGLARLPSPRVR